MLMENDQHRGANIIFYRRFPVSYSLLGILPTDLATLGTGLHHMFPFSYTCSSTVYVVRPAKKRLVQLL